MAKNKENLYIGELKKSKRQYDKVLKKSVTKIITDEFRKTNLRKNLITEQLIRQRKKAHSKNETVDVHYLNTFDEDYIHSNKTLAKWNWNHILLKKLNEFNQKEFLNQNAKRAQTDFLNLFKQVQTNNKVNSSLLNTFFDLIDNQEKAQIISQFMSSLEDIIADALSLKNVRDARIKYANNETLKNSEKVFRIIQEGGENGLKQLNNLLNALDEIYNIFYNIPEGSTEKYLSNLLGIRTVVNSLISKNFNSGTLHTISKAIQATLSQSGVERIRLKTFAKYLRSFFGLLSNSTKIDHKGAATLLKQNAISKGLAQQMQLIADEKTYEMLLKTQNKFKATPIRFQQTGEKTVKNSFYKKKAITQTTDGKLVLAIEEEATKEKFFLDIGLSVKFYQGLANQIYKNKKISTNQPLDISLGGRGSLKELIHAIIEHKETTKLSLYNYITFASQNQNKWDSFSNFVAVRYFTRLSSTGGSLYSNDNTDLSSFIIINGVPFSIWELLQEIQRQINENENSHISLLSISYNEQENPHFQNPWIGGKTPDINSAITRSHATVKSIDSTYIKATLHLNKLSTLSQKIEKYKDKNNPLSSKALLTI